MKLLLTGLISGNPRNIISITNNGHGTRVQNKNLSTDNVRPECQLDQQEKSLTGGIDQLWLIKFDKTKLIQKNFGLMGLVNCYGGNPKWAMVR